MLPSAGPAPAADPREDALREFAALGNDRGVALLLAGGAKQTGNPVNGWTPLHWASHRGHAAVVRLLLSCGAAPAAVNSSGQTAADLAKTPAVKALLGVCADGDSREQMQSFAEYLKTTLGFVPSFVENPDLTKVWGVPDTGARVQAAQPPSSAPSAAGDRADRGAGAARPAEVPAAVVASSPGGSEDTAEPILVYRYERKDDRLAGFVCVRRTQTIADAASLMCEELGFVPEFLELMRHDGKRAIPIARKQWRYQLREHFRSSDDVFIAKYFEYRGKT